MGRIAIRLLLTAAGCLSVAAAQDQPGFVRDTCVKVAPGKGAELEAMLHDVTAKQMRVRIDEGHAAWWLALSAGGHGGKVRLSRRGGLRRLSAGNSHARAEHGRTEEGRPQHDHRGICG